ncbi:MAG TPA: Rrf2 family transcriptional regulator, partial [Spirochaetia bacterium]|nr:Rrf2 family transcriptional regulator [Spirochaetia bacterium]
MKREQTQEELKLIERLKQFDTPSITNVVATYPADRELCLGLYDPWACNWYTDQSLKCIFPELGPLAGYAVTVVYGPASSDFNRLGFNDVLRAIDARRGPGGGLRLARPAEEIRLIDIVSLFDGSKLFEECALGLPGCREGEH